MNNTRLSFFKASASKESLKLERAKIAFQFLLMTVCSLIMGILISGGLSDSFYSDAVTGISAHFENAFLNCHTFYDKVLHVVLYSLSDLICLTIIFCVSFAVFNYVVSDFVLIYNGIKFGFLTSFLSKYLFGRVASYNINTVEFFTVVFFKVTTLILILDYAYRAAVYSIGLKETKFNGRPSVKLRVLFPFCINTLAYMGSIIILNGLYCWLIYIF